MEGGKELTKEFVITLPEEKFFGKNGGSACGPEGDYKQQDRQKAKGTAARKEPLSCSKGCKVSMGALLLFPCHHRYCGNCYKNNVCPICNEQNYQSADIQPINPEEWTLNCADCGEMLTDECAALTCGHFVCLKCRVKLRISCNICMSEEYSATCLKWDGIFAVETRPEKGNFIITVRRETDSRKEIQRVEQRTYRRELHKYGIPSTGLSCYASCILHVLRETPSFLDFSKLYPKDSVSQYLHDILQEGGSYNMKNDTLQKIIKKVSKSDTSFTPYKMNDCHSFFLHVLELLRKEPTGGKDRLFELKLEMVRRCGYKSCDYQSERTEQRLTCLIPVRSHVLALNIENLYGIEKTGLPCKQCKTKNALSEITKIGEPFPPVIVLHIKRLKETSHGPYKVDEKIHYFDELYFINNAGKKQERYVLYGALFHEGFERGGHYVVVVKQKNGDWNECDNTSVEKCAESSAFEYKRAYMLFYKKDNL